MNIKSALIRKNKTARWLAEKMGVTMRTIESWKKELPKNKVKLDRLKELLK